MAVFFTSDTHFGHESVIRNCDRPFSSSDEMDEVMIARWNALIRAGDTIYHLGDFCHRNLRDAPDYLDSLNGHVHLIAGNHDVITLKKHSARFASVSVMHELMIGGRLIVLCHYPLREWNGCYSGSWHLHGHVHGRLNDAPLGHSMDVGVDSNGFQPWSLDAIADVLKERDSPFGGHRAPPVRKTIRALSPQESP